MFHLFFLLTVPVVLAEFNEGANWISQDSPIIYMKSTMDIPKLPAIEWSTLFIWPGIQPYKGPNFMPIDNGVLQPVLSLGYSCAPNPTNLAVKDTEYWWVSAQYVNTVGNAPGYSGCYGGNRMPVYPGDKLVFMMELVPGTTLWKQTITSRNTGKSVDFTFDMKGQDQYWAEFVIETTNGWHSNPPAFTVSEIEIRTAGASAFNYYPTTRSNPGGSLECSQPQVQGNTCKIDYCKFNGGSSSPVSPNLPPPPPSNLPVPTQPTQSTNLPVPTQPTEPTQPKPTQPSKLPTPKPKPKPAIHYTPSSMKALPTSLVEIPTSTSANEAAATSVAAGGKKKCKKIKRALLYLDQKP